MTYKAITEFKLSSLDKRAPPGVTIMFRIVGEPGGRAPPPVLGDFADPEKAKAFSAKLSRERQHHSYLTWWRNAEGQHVHKWGTLLKGRSRYFRLKVPYVQGFSDDMVKECLLKAILRSQDVPEQYTTATVTVRADPDANRMEVSGVVKVTVPPEVTARIDKWSEDYLRSVVLAAINAAPDEEPPYV